IENITVCTFSSAVIWAPKIGDRFGLVIVDEAHHVGAWCPADVLRMLAAPDRLGLTATPPGANDESGQQSDDRAGPLTALVGPVVYSISIDELRGTALADFDLITVPIELEPDERKLYRENRARFSSVFAPHQRATHGSSWQDFVRDARRTRAGRDALNSWRSYRQLLSYSSGKRSMLRELLALHAGQRTLIFTGDVATAYAIAKELLVQPITHEIGKAERADVLARFRSGEISALVSAQVLDEGLDVPDADVAIIVGGSSSARRHVQRIGRVLRPRDGKRARIYELAVNDSTELSYVTRRRAGLADRGDRAAEPKRERAPKRTASADRQRRSVGGDRRDCVPSIDSTGGDTLEHPPCTPYRYPLVGDITRAAASPHRPRPYPVVAELLAALNIPIPTDGGAL
ncbi:MAG TPA: DEAD/DEAH box helicase, partial [Kofleriaceae bacterium]